MSSQSSSSDSSPPSTRAPAPALPSDLIRHILSFACWPRTVWSASLVSSSWLAAVDHPTTWRSLCAHAQWVLPESAMLDAHLARDFFIRRYLTVRFYSRAYWRRRAWAAHQAGIVAIAVPKVKRFYSWTDGEQKAADENSIISAASAPTYGMRVWQLDASSSSSGSSSSSVSGTAASAGVTCVREEHVYGNPLLAGGLVGDHHHAPGGGATNPPPVVPVPGQAHPLDPRDANLKAHWSCVDIVAGDAGGQTEMPNETFAGGCAPFAGASFTAASSSTLPGFSRDSSYVSSVTSAPPPTEFLLFAGMHRPVLYLHDLGTRRLRSFAPGHESAVCCVRMGRAATAFTTSVTRKNRPPTPAISARLAISGGYDHSACVWDVDTGALIARLTGGCEHTVWCTDIHLGRRLVAAGADDGIIRIFRIRKTGTRASKRGLRVGGGTTAQTPQAPATDAPIDDSSDEDEEADLTPAQVAERRRDEKLREMRRIINSAAAAAASSPTAETATTPMTEPPRPTRPSRYASNEPAAAEEVPVVVDPALAEAAARRDFGGRLVSVLRGHTKSPMTLQFDPESGGRRLWSAGYDRDIRLWDVSQVGRRTNKAQGAAAPDSDSEVTFAPCLRVLSGHTGVVFSLVLTSHVLVSTSRDGSVVVWERDSGLMLRRLDAGRADSGLISEIASQAGSSEEAASLASSRAQSLDVKCAAVTPDGDIVTAASDGRIAVFQFERRGTPSTTNATNDPTAASPPPIWRANSTAGHAGNARPDAQEQSCAIM